MLSLTIDSKIFATDDVKLIGLYLFCKLWLPFLKISVIYRIFHSSGKVDDSSDFVNIMHKGEHIWAATSFSTAIGHPSGPGD